MITERANCCFRFAAIVAVLALGAVGCSERPPALPNMNLPMAQESALGASSSDDAWPTFAYDYTRSGFNPNVTNVTKNNVSTLALRWEANLGDTIFASPVTYGGNLIVATLGSWGGHPGSVVYDLSTSDGHVIWKYALGRRQKMTPTIDPEAGLVFVGRQGPSSYLFALRLLDGTVVWHQAVPGLLTAPPVVSGGSVYIGRAGGDAPRCQQGGVTAFNESTGQEEWVWNVDPHLKKGGSVWGALAFDGTHLTFGTGNTCERPITTANGAVALDLYGNLLWNMVAVKDSRADSDTGGGVMLYNGLAHFMNKNGRFYAVDNDSGKIQWKKDLNPYVQPPNWRGGFATPSTDGSTIVVGTGTYKGTSSAGSGEFCMMTDMKPNEYFKGYHSELQAMDTSGTPLWSVQMQNRLIGYVALANGIGFVGLNQQFEALDLSSGQTLWSYATPDFINASMIVVPSGLYGADQAGNVYAFSVSSPRKP